MSDSSLVVAFMNIKGQTKLKIDKQMQIEAFLKFYKCDILHLQESNIESDTFSTCDFITSSYNIELNNSPTLYGTASLIKSTLTYENIKCDTQGRVLLFDICGITFGNVYLNSGTDAVAKNGREHICSEILPNMLKFSGFVDA